MSTVAAESAVIRTDRGLTIAGTRITLYDVMDYVATGWPARLIGDRLQLSDQQMSEVMAYIAAHHAEVVAEYEHVLKTADENRAYWDQHNRARMSTPTVHTPVDSDSLRAKLNDWKRKLGPEA